MNPITARKAIARLVGEGLLYKIHRKGTFVSPPSRNQLVLIVTTRQDFSVVGSLTPIAARYPHLQWLEISVEDLRPHLAEVKYVFPRLIGTLFVRDLTGCIDVMRELQNLGVPVWFYGSDIHAPFLEMTHSLLYREHEVIGMGLQHLRDCGCRNMGFLGGDEWAAFLARREAFRKWNHANGHTIEEGNEIVLPQSELKDPTRCFDLIRTRLRSKAFDADGVVCVNDQCSPVFVQAARSLGVKIPDQLKVVGVEDDETLTAWTIPQVSSVRIPFHDDIRAAFDAISMGRRQGNRIERQWSKPFLVPRHSTVST